MKTEVMAAIIDEWKPLKEDVEKIMDVIDIVALTSKERTADLTSSVHTDESP